MANIKKSQKTIGEEAKRAVLSELNMTETCLDESVDNLKSWLNLQPHLPHRIDSALLRSFIIGSRSIEVAKEKLNEYFMARINYAAELSNRNPMDIEWNNIQPMAYLPDLTPEGYVVLLVTLPDLNVCPGFDFLQSIRLVTMMSEIILRERPYITGQIYLMDLGNLSIKLVPKISITYLVNALYLFDHAFPFVMKAIYNFNTPQLADSLQRTLIKPVLSDGFYNMIMSYTEDAKALEKHFPIDLLPQDYGGKAPCLKDIMNNWRLKLENSKDLFSGECSLLPDKSKMPKKITDSSNFGSSGTFRKLNID